MGIRQILNEKPAISTTVTGLVIAASIGFIIWQFVGGNHGPSHGPIKAFYSDDDGKTYFTEEGNKITPFTDKNGKQAVQAVVYKCDDQGPFVAYLMQYTAEGRKIASQANPMAAAHGANVSAALMEIKRPGDAKWVQFDPKNPKIYTELMIPKCPNGSTQGLRPVFP